MTPLNLTDVEWDMVERDAEALSKSLLWKVVVHRYQKLQENTVTEGFKRTSTPQEREYRAGEYEAYRRATLILGEILTEAKSPHTRRK